jgi:predicted small lipoprotein YifL
MSNIEPILCSKTLSSGLSLVAVLWLLAGCGQKGDLFLPTEPAAANRATLPQILNPGGTPTSPAPPTTGTTPGGTGTGTAAPVRTP